ncbi:MAG: glycosyltransferase [Chloroflexota bacterium]
MGRIIFGLGLAIVVADNVRRWWRDRELADQLRAERARKPPLTRTPKVSALVAAWNEGDRIDDHIRSFLALRYPNVELILGAGGNDDTFRRAARYTSDRVVVLEQRPGEGKQRALAHCFERASGEIILLTDADCLYQDDALAALLRPLIEQGEQVATGTSRPLDEQMDKTLPAYAWFADLASAARSPAYVEGLLGRNAALTRQALDRSGGLAFSARTGTDYHLAKRLIRSGFRIRQVGASVVPSRYPERLGAYRRQRSRWLRNLLIHGHRYGATRDVAATLGTILTGALMVIAPALAPVAGRRVLMPWCWLVAHALGSKLRSALFTARVYQRPIPVRVLVGLPWLTIVDFAVWASPIFDLLSPRRRERW